MINYIEKQSKFSVNLLIVKNENMSIQIPFLSLKIGNSHLLLFTPAL